MHTRIKWFYNFYRATLCSRNVTSLFVRFLIIRNARLVACTRPVNTGSGCTGLNFVFCLLVLSSFYCTVHVCECHCVLNSYLLTYLLIAVYAMAVCLSVCPVVHHTPVLYLNWTNWAAFFPQRLPSIYPTLHFKETRYLQNKYVLLEMGSKIGTLPNFLPLWPRHVDRRKLITLSVHFGLQYVGRDSECRAVLSTALTRKGCWVFKRKDNELALAINSPLLFLAKTQSFTRDSNQFL